MPIFCKSNIGDAYKAMIDDMVNKMDFSMQFLILIKLYPLLKTRDLNFIILYILKSIMNIHGPCSLDASASITMEKVP